MDLTTSNPGIGVEDEDWVYIANGSGRSTPRLQIPGKDRARRSPQVSKVWRTKRIASTGRIERQSRKPRASTSRREDEGMISPFSACINQRASLPFTCLILLCSVHCCGGLHQLGCFHLTTKPECLSCEQQVWIGGNTRVSTTQFWQPCCPHPSCPSSFPMLQFPTQPTLKRPFYSFSSRSYVMHSSYYPP